MARKPKPSGRRKGRSLGKLTRRAGDKRGRQSILIVCEGTKTEPLYFRALRKKLRLNTVDVQVEHSGHNTAPIRVVKRASALRKDRVQKTRQSNIEPEFDEVWCVIDTENTQHNATFHQAVELAKQENIDLAISAPCFEFWYLLHFKKSARPFVDGKELKRELQKYIAEYHESLDVFEQLFPETEVAIKHAEELLKKHPDDRPYPNPSTLVHLLVRKLLSM